MPASIIPSSPTSGPISLSIIREKTYTFAIAVTQADGITPQDLTDATLLFYAQVGLALIAKSSSPPNGITITSLTGGLATLQIDPVDTLLVFPGGIATGPCELTVQLDGNNFDLASGTLVVSSNVGTP
jgi:hypothetical protein